MTDPNVRNVVARAAKLQEEINALGAGPPPHWCPAVSEVVAYRAENERLRAALERGKTLVEEMDQRMPEQATEDADGWINSYRIPVGPWHRLLGWARGGLPDL